MPRVFLVLGVCYGIMQLVGLLLISEPTEEEAKQLEEQSTPLLQESSENAVASEPAETLVNSNEIAIPTSQPVAQPVDQPVVVKEPEGLSSSEVLKTGRFWQIWSTLLFVSMTNIFISSFYKVREE